MKILGTLVLLCATGAACAAESDTPQTVDAALAAAQREQRPLFIDFQAQWCYSCYYMATHVLSGPKWRPFTQRMRELEVDADSPDGAAWMTKLGIKALPSFVVLKPDGAELGRIVAEQPPEKFYPALERILAGSDALDALRAQAAKGSVPAIADALAGYHARSEYSAGLDWYATLPAALRAKADKDARAAQWHDRLQLEVAAKAKDDRACIAAAQRVLSGDPGCDRYYVVETLLGCSEKTPQDQRRKLLAAQRPALDSLLNEQVFVTPPRCADQRSAVMASAELDNALGDAAAEKALFDRAIAFVRAQLGDDFAKDRNLADNLRVYLTHAERSAELDALMPKLMAAYPDDYVYAYRYGRSLLDRKKPAEALPYLEQAAEKTFGANRLVVAQLRVKALLALNRRSDAQKVAADALQANGPWFPEAAAELKALLKG
jgi:hypothetical protein